MAPEFYGAVVDREMDGNNVMVCKSLILVVAAKIADEKERNATLIETEVRQAIELLDRTRKLAKSMNHGNYEIVLKKKSELIQLVEKFHNQYQSLHFFNKDTREKEKQDVTEEDKASSFSYSESEGSEIYYTLKDEKENEILYLSKACHVHEAKMVKQLITRASDACENEGKFTPNERIKALGRRFGSKTSAKIKAIEARSLKSGDKSSEISVTVQRSRKQIWMHANAEDNTNEYQVELIIHQQCKENFYQQQSRTGLERSLYTVGSNNVTLISETRRGGPVVPAKAFWVSKATWMEKHLRIYYGSQYLPNKMFIFTSSFFLVIRMMDPVMMFYGKGHLLMCESVVE
ncbi:hypothetical protein POM88_049241 [Heracleum sosnowskyi]|uniref:Uncharacterized protein n=1 Tax=Heracleum sosnowskyi TaxID=360622 RepID=A0AAD8GV98_9APIA|nr:hypothetical protein POM88_049241 [Heracleum sosnowskyi]